MVKLTKERKLANYAKTYVYKDLSKPIPNKITLKTREKELE